ncbi:MAG: YceI family protein [Chloroflexi bacterium]|nr:YceI family protein [Chloroflexota bacterium]
MPKRAKRRRSTKRPGSTASRLLISIAGIALVGVIVLAAGWWFFVRSDAKLATEPPAIPQDILNTTGTPGDGSGLVTFRIIADRSEAAYFVSEQLASLRIPSTASGTTSDIEGEFHLTADGIALAADTTSQFTIGLTTLRSDESRRVSRVQEALETGTFPTATFTFTSFTGYDPSIPEGEQQDLLLTGTLDLHGVQRQVTWKVEALRQANVITALATVTIAFADYGITPPSVGGFTLVGNEATLQVQLVAEAS